MTVGFVSVYHTRVNLNHDKLSAAAADPYEKSTWCEIYPLNFIVTFKSGIGAPSWCDTDYTVLA